MYVKCRSDLKNADSELNTQNALSSQLLFGESNNGALFVALLCSVDHLLNVPEFANEIVDSLLGKVQHESRPSVFV